MGNGKINQAAKKAQELYVRLFKKQRFIEKVNMPKGVYQFF